MLGTPIDDDYVYELTGIPKPDGYEEMKAEQEAAKAEKDLTPNPSPQGEGEKKKPHPNPSPKERGKATDKKDEKLAFKAEFKEALNDFFGNALD